MLKDLEIIKLWKFTIQPLITVDLSKYRVTRWQNGSASWTSQYSDALSGKLAPKDVVVLVLDRRDTTQIGQDTPVVMPLRLKADLFIK